MAAYPGQVTFDHGGLKYNTFAIHHVHIFRAGNINFMWTGYCIPRTKYVRGILWFSRRYAAASAYHRLRDNLKNPYRIASIFYNYVD